MSFINLLGEYKDKKDKFSYTIITHSYTSEELVGVIKNKLENINKKIKNSFKKKFINERIYSLIVYLESKFNVKDQVNSIFLINEEIYSFPFTKKDRTFCLDWNISQFIIDYDEQFNIDYLIELFSIDSIKTVFKFDKTEYSIMEMDSTKSKKIESHSSMDETSILEMVETHKPLIIYGMNQVLKKLYHLENDGIVVKLKNMNNEEIIDIINTKEVEENQEMFKTEFLDNLNNPHEQDKLIYGRKEVGEAIVGFLVKKIFVNPRMLKILREKVDNSILNFKIVVVKTLTSGDYGQTLNKDYGGIVAIKYYA
jgi:hypothetical protein